MKILFIGDIVGRPGRNLITRFAPTLRVYHALDLIVANAENATSGSGLNLKAYKQLREAGVDAITMGDHVYRKREIVEAMCGDEPICRPANYPASAPGRDHILLHTADRVPVAIFYLLGRLFMKPVDCPFTAADRQLEKLAPQAKVILVDIHAEATSEKQMMGRYLAGRASAVVGTHTHVPTADAGLLPPGTAYITDVGMTGPYEGVIGRRFDRVMHTTLTCDPTPFDVATGDPRLSAVLIEVDATNGSAIDINLLHHTQAELEEMAASVTVRP